MPVSFVWRQLKLVFFGVPASVGALFIFGGIMAKLTQILTHQLDQNDLKEYSEEAAEKNGEDWVTTESIQKYNDSLNLNTLSAIKKIVRFLFVLHPYIGYFCCILLPMVIAFPLSIIFPDLSFSFIFLGIFGMFIGFVAGSFIFPSLVTSCKKCGSIKKCECIFTHCLEYEDHTEKRYSNGVQYKYLVRDEIVFCIYECENCKSRKIEVLKQRKEKRI